MGNLSLPFLRQASQQPQRASLFAPGLRPNAAFNAALGPHELVGGAPISILAGTPTGVVTPAGVALNVWRGNALCPLAGASTVEALLAVFRMDNTAVDGAIICGSSGTYGPTLRMVSGVLQFVVTTNGAANVVATQTLVNGETYAVFCYTTGSSTALRYIYINGVDKSGTRTSNGIAAQPMTRLCIGSTAGLADSRASVSLSMGAVWKGKLFNPSLAASLSRKPWQIFASRTPRLFVPLAGGSSLNAAAAGAAQSSGAASLTAQVALAAVGVSSAAGSASASVAVPLSAAGIAVSDGSAAASATVTISAAGLAQVAGSAGLSAAVLLAGAGAASAAGNAALAVQLDALAAGAAEASGTANLTGGAPGALAATGGAQASGSAVLSVSVSLQATGAAQASGSANLTGGAPGALSASDGAVADGWASWTALVSMTAAGFVQAMGAGAFSVEVPLSASGQAIAAGQANAALLGETRHYRLGASVSRLTLASSADQRATRASCGARRATTLHHEVRHA